MRRWRKHSGNRRVLAQPCHLAPAVAQRLQLPGQTHTSTQVAVEACESRQRVRFYTSIPYKWKVHLFCHRSAGGAQNPTGVAASRWQCYVGTMLLMRMLIRHFI